MALSVPLPNMWDVNHGLSAIKPMNLISILRVFYKTRSMRVRIAQVIKFFELYDLYWCSTLPHFESVAHLLADVLQRLPSLFSDFKGWLVSHSILPTQNVQVDGTTTGTPDMSASMQHQSAVKDTLQTFLSRFNITIPDWFDSIAVSVLSFTVPIVVLIGGFIGSGFDITTRLMKSVVAVGSTCKAWEAIGSSFTQMFNLVKTSAAAAFEIDLESDSPKGKLTKQIMEIKTRITNMCNEFEVNPFAAFSRPEAMSNISHEIDRAEKTFLSIANNDTNTASLRYLLDDMRAARDKLVERNEDIIRSSVGKCHPTVIWLFGASGVGKSYLASKLVDELSAIEQRKLLLYTRNPGDKYWSGYVGQDIVLYDDFGAAKEATEHLELQKIYTDSAYALEHAEATKKGRPFSSRYVIICSNFAYMGQSQILNDPGILHRRRDILLHVQFDNRDRYLLPNGNLDTSRLNGFGHLNIQEMPVMPRQDGNLVHFGNPWNLAQMAQRMYDIQVPRSQQFQTALTAMRHNANRPPIVLLMGDSGVGKTSSFCHVPEHIKTYDELPVTDAGFRQMVELAWKYDDPTFPGCVMACNETTLNKMIEKHHPKDPQWREAFMRRLTVYKFSFRYRTYSGLLGYKFTNADLAGKDYDSCVLIEKYVKNRFVLNIPYISMCKELSELSHIYEKNQFSLKLRTRKMDFEPGFVVKARCSEADMTKKFDLSDFTLVKGSYLSAHKYVTALAPMFCRDYQTTELALLAFENANVPLSDSALLVLQDSNFALIPENGKASVFRIIDDKVEQELAQLEATTVWKKILPYFEIFETLFKMTAGLYCVLGEEYHDIEYNHTYKVLCHYCGEKYFPIDYPAHEDDTPDSAGRLKKGRKRYQLPTTCPRCESRDWASECPEEPEPSPYDWAFTPIPTRKIPKSAMPSQVKDSEYCEFHHKFDKCFMVAENRKMKFAYGAETTTMAQPKTFSTPSSDLPVVIGKSQLLGEACLDRQALAVSDAVTKNVVTIGTVEALICHGVMIHGRIGVTNAHAVPNQIGAQFKITADYLIDATVIKYNEQRDIAIFKLPDTHREYKDIRSHLPKMGMVTDFNGYKAILNTPRRVGDSKFVIQKVLTLNAVTYMEIENVKKFGIQYHGHLEGASYDPILTVNGDCGSPIIVLDARKQEKFIGFHSAANVYTGFGTLIYRDDFEFKHESNETIHILPHQWVQPVEEKDYLLFKIFGQPHDGSSLVEQNMPKTTHLYRSPLQGFFSEELFEPAVFSRRDKRNTKEVDPYELAMNKWSHEQPSVDTVLLDHVADEVATYLAGKIFENKLKTTVLTKTEAINGVSYLPGSNPIYRHSSAGYPFKHWPGVARKEVFFEQDIDTLLFTIAKNEQGRRLNNAVDALVTAAKQGKRTAVVFSGALKDEPLKLKKIYDVVDSRSFAGSPLDYTLAHRMYFHGAVAALTSIHDQIPIKIGIDAGSTEYNTLYYYHAKVSKFGFDIDFKKWDSTVVLDFMKKLPFIYNTIYRYNDPNYDPRDDITRTALHSVLHGPLLMYYNRVVQSPGGMVSGQPATATDNCIINMMYQYYIWCQLAAENDKTKCNYSSFLQHVASSVYGDDNIVTVSPEVMSWFNLESYVNKLKLLNLEATDADKTGVMTMKKLEDMSFLKRRFTKFGRYYVGALEDASFNRMLGWTRLNKSHYGSETDVVAWDIATIQQTIQCALREGSLRGKDFYERLIWHIRSCCQRHSIPVYEWPSFADQVQTVIFRNSSVNEVASLMNEQFEDYYFNQEYDPENGQVISSTSSSRQRRVTNGRQLRKRNSRSTVTDTSANDTWPRNCVPSRTNERVGQIPIRTISVNSNTNLDNSTTSGNSSLLDSTSSIKNEQPDSISHQALQHMGWWLSVQNEDCWNRFSRGSFDAISFTTKYPSKYNNYSGAGNRFRMGNFRPKDFGIGNTVSPGSKEYPLPLQQRLRRERSQQFWWLSGSDGKHATGYIVHWNKCYQCSIVQQIGSIFSSITGHPTRDFSNYYNPKRDCSCPERYKPTSYYRYENTNINCGECFSNKQHIQCCKIKRSVPYPIRKLCKNDPENLDNIRAFCSHYRKLWNRSTVVNHAKCDNRHNRNSGRLSGDLWSNNQFQGSEVSSRYISTGLRHSNRSLRRLPDQRSKCCNRVISTVLPNTKSLNPTGRLLGSDSERVSGFIHQSNNCLWNNPWTQSNYRITVSCSSQILPREQAGLKSMPAFHLAGQSNRFANSVSQIVSGGSFDDFILNISPRVQHSSLRDSVCAVYTCNRSSSRSVDNNDHQHVPNRTNEWIANQPQRGLTLSLPLVNESTMYNNTIHRIKWPQQQQQSQLPLSLRRLVKHPVASLEPLVKWEQLGFQGKLKLTQLISLMQERIKDRPLQIMLLRKGSDNSLNMENKYRKFRITLTATQLWSCLTCAALITNQPDYHPTLVGKEETYRNKFLKSFSSVMATMVMQLGSSVIQCLRTLLDLGYNNIMDGEMLLLLIKRITNVKFDSSLMCAKDGKLQVFNCISELRTYLSSAKESDWFVVSQLFGFHTYRLGRGFGVHPNQRQENSDVPTMGDQNQSPIQCPDISSTTDGLEAIFGLPWAEIEAVLVGIEPDMFREDLPILDEADINIFLASLPLDNSSTAQNQCDDNGVSSTTQSDQLRHDGPNLSMGEDDDDQPIVFNPQPNQLPQLDDDNDWGFIDDDHFNFGS